jgi:hypothetical protein
MVLALSLLLYIGFNFSLNGKMRQDMVMPRLMDPISVEWWVVLLAPDVYHA